MMDATQQYRDYAQKVEAIKQDPTYQQILKDSMGGVLYNVANYGKYDTKELLALWDAMTEQERNAVDGIVKGAINFARGK